MAGTGPKILVVGDQDEGGAIATLLREAGFSVTVAAQARGGRAALTRQCFAAAVVALPEDHAVRFQRHLRRRHPGLPALIVIEPAATGFSDDDGDRLLARPFDPRRLLGQILELVLPDDRGARPDYRRTAELGIAAARLSSRDSAPTAAP